MATFLDRLRREKLEELSRRRTTAVQAEMERAVESMEPPRGFASCLCRPDSASLALIAEIKIRAPGRTNIDSLDLAGLIGAYEAGGASALSVLTDEKYFGGSLSLLDQTRRHTSLPLLHKEFIVDPFQLLEGRAAGADAALILAYYFSSAELAEMIARARALGLEPVVECSMEDEVERTVAASPDVILINNRPIAALPEEPTATYRLGSITRAREFWENHPELRHWKGRSGRVLISASCIDKRADIDYLAALPYDAALVGNAAASSPDPAGFLTKLRCRAAAE